MEDTNPPIIRKTPIFEDLFVLLDLIERRKLLSMKYLWRKSRNDYVSM